MPILVESFDVLLYVGCEGTGSSDVEACGEGLSELSVFSKRRSEICGVKAKSGERLVSDGDVDCSEEREV